MPRFQRIDVEDDYAFQWAYAAQLKGAFGIEPQSRAEFRQTFRAAVEAADAMFMLLATIKRPKGAIEETPVGIVRALVREHQMEPHVWWLPWATPRAKMETSASFLLAQSRTFLVLVTASRPEAPLYERLCQYDVLRRIGTVPNYYPDGSEAVMFHGKQQ